MIDSHKDIDCRRGSLNTSDKSSSGSNHPHSGGSTSVQFQPRGWLHATSVVQIQPSAASLKELPWLVSLPGTWLFSFVRRVQQGARRRTSVLRCELGAVYGRPFLASKSNHFEF